MAPGVLENWVGFGAAVALFITWLLTDHRRTNRHHYALYGTKKDESNGLGGDLVAVKARLDALEAVARDAEKQRDANTREVEELRKLVTGLMEVHRPRRMEERDSG